MIDFITWLFDTHYIVSTMFFSEFSLMYWIYAWSGIRILMSILVMIFLFISNYDKH